MKLRTEIQIPKSPFSISHQAKILSIGSCFAERIGQKLKDHKFNTLINPCGIIFNPVSVFSFIENSIHPSSPLKFVVQNDRWYSFHHHSSVSASTQAGLADKIRELHEQTLRFLATADVLIITLGTAFVYEHIPENSIVANCHKVASNQFRKRLLTVDEIVASFNNVYSALTAINNKMQLIFTVSPVRHTKDSLPLNSVSKSILRLATHQITEGNANVNYFPSYEMMMDDLRDYRFYKDDLIHPTEFAENYIWKEFQSSYFSEQTIQLNAEWADIKNRLNHHAFNQSSESHQAFLQQTLLKLKAFNSRVNCEDELKEFLEKNFSAN